MLKTFVYKCKDCGSILVLQDSWNLNRVRCTVCGSSMQKLNDDFDLSEIIECESCKTEVN